MRPDSYFEALTRMAWAYLFLCIDFSLNLGPCSVNLLPDWLGFLLIFYSLPLLQEQKPTAALLKPPAILLGVCDVVFWILESFLGITDFLTLVQLICSALTMYFNFQLFTDLASIAADHGLSHHARSLRRVRSAVTIYAAVFSVTLQLYPLDTLSTMAAALLTVGTMCLTVWFVSSLFLFRNAERSRMFYEAS